MLTVNCWPNSETKASETALFYHRLYHYNSNMEWMLDHCWNTSHNHHQSTHHHNHRRHDHQSNEHNLIVSNCYAIPFCKQNLHWATNQQSHFVIRWCHYTELFPDYGHYFSVFSGQNSISTQIIRENQCIHSQTPNISFIDGINTEYLKRLIVHQEK